MFEVVNFFSNWGNWVYDKVFGSMNILTSPPFPGAGEGVGANLSQFTTDNSFLLLGSGEVQHLGGYVTNVGDINGVDMNSRDVQHDDILSSGVIVQGNDRENAFFLTFGTTQARSNNTLTQPMSGNNPQWNVILNDGNGGVTAKILAPSNSTEMIYPPFGRIASRLGDINNDGFSDFGILSQDASTLYVILGNTIENLFNCTGGLFSCTEIPNANGNGMMMVPTGRLMARDNSDAMTTGKWFMVTSEDPITSFAPLGDVGGGDSDSVDDFVIGTPSSDQNAGSAHVIFGSASIANNNINLSNLPGSSQLRINAPMNDNNLLGQFVMGAGSLTGNGRDILIETGNGDITYILKGGNSTSLCGITSGNCREREITITDSNLKLLRISDTYVQSHEIISIGKFNDDNYDDIAFSNARDGGNSGIVRILYGEQNIFSSSISLSDTPCIIGDDNARLGISIAGLGDVSGDEYHDIGILSRDNPQPADTDGYSVYSAHIVLGRKQKFEFKENRCFSLENINNIPDQPEGSGKNAKGIFHISGIRIDDADTTTGEIASQFLSQISSAGDFNAETTGIPVARLDDILIGADAHINAGIQNAGSVAVIRGQHLNDTQFNPDSDPNLVFQNSPNGAMDYAHDFTLLGALGVAALVALEFVI